MTTYYYVKGVDKVNGEKFIAFIDGCDRLTEDKQKADNQKEYLGHHHVDVTYTVETLNI